MLAMAAMRATLTEVMTPSAYAHMMLTCPATQASQVAQLLRALDDVRGRH